MNTYTQALQTNNDSLRTWLRAELQKSVTTLPLHKSPTAGAPSWVFDVKSLCLRPEVLAVVAKLFWEVFPEVHECQVGGLETASIPFVAAIVLEGHAQGKRVSGFYVRKGRKKTDLAKHVEGSSTGSPVILVDDLMNRGRSFERLCVVLKEEGWPSIIGAFALVRFRESMSYQFLNEKNIKIVSVFTLADFGLALPTTESCGGVTLEVVSYIKSKYADRLYTGERAVPLHVDSALWWGTDHGHIWELQSRNFAVLSHRKVGFLTRQHFLTTFALTSQYVYCMSHRGVLYVFERSSKRLHKHISVSDRAAIGPILLRQETRLICFGTDAGGGVVIAFDADTLQQIWRYEAVANIVGVAVKISEDTCVCADVKGNLYRISPWGVKRWKVFPSGRVALSYDQHNSGNLYAAHENGILYEVPSKKMRFIKKHDHGGPLYAPPSIIDGVIYLSTESGDLVALEQKTGELRWLVDLGARCFNTPTIYGGRLYVGTNAGRLHVYDCMSGKELGSYLVAERIVSAVTVESENSIVFVTAMNELYRLRVIVS